MLAPYGDNPIASSCITLIDTGSLGALPAYQTKAFSVIDLRDLFESPTILQNDLRRGRSSPVMNWLNYASGIPARTANPGHSIWSTNPPDSKSSWETSNPKVLLNVNKHRLDRPLDLCDSKILESMTLRAQAEQFCNWYYLGGGCSINNCKYNHHEDLNDEELKALSVIARRSPCGFLGRCRNPKCFFGHICPSLPNCSCGRGGRLCPFKDTHGEDRSIVHVW